MKFYIVNVIIKTPYVIARLIVCKEQIYHKEKSLNRENYVFKLGSLNLREISYSPMWEA